MGDERHVISDIGANMEVSHIMDDSVYSFEFTGLRMSRQLLM